MATSAKKEVTCGYNGHYHLYMTITVNSQDRTNNKSNVTVKMYAKSDSTTYGAYNLSSSANSVKLTVDGSQKVNKTMAMDFRDMAIVNLASWTGDISHDSEGKKKLTCSGSFTIDGSSWLSGGDISLSIDLDDIPRATKPTLSVSSVELGKTLKIGISPAASGWTHRIYYRFGSGSWTRFATDQTGDYTWTVPEDLANSITDATSATLTIGLNTYNGSTQIGTTQTVNVKVTVPSSVNPSISSVTVSEGVSEIASGYGVYIQGKSKLHIVTDASGAYSSAISSIKHKIGGTDYTANADYTSGFITVSGDIDIVTTVTDSRGRTASKTTTITVYAYDAPKITKFTAIRCGEGGAVNNNGTYVKVSMAFSVSPINNKNAKSYQLEYKTAADDTYTKIVSGNTYSYDDVYITGNTFLAANSYDIRLVVADSFTESEAVVRVNVASRLMSYIIAKMAIAIGKVAELANTFDVALETIFRKSVSMYDNLTVAGDISEGGALLSKKYNSLVSVTARNSTAIADKSVSNASNTNLGSITLEAGTWLVFIYVHFASNTSGRRSAWLATSATGSSMEGAALDNRAPVSGAVTACKIHCILTPSSSTKYYLNCYQNSGSTLTVTTRYTLVKLK